MPLRLAVLCCALTLLLPLAARAQSAAPAPVPAVWPSAEPWQLPMALEANRPQIQVRTLSAEERKEARALAASYRREPSQAGLDRLKALAESGDADTLLLMRDSIGRGVPPEFAARFADTPTTRRTLATLADMLAALWTAHYWARHGVEEDGIPRVAACIDGLHDAKGKATEGVVGGPRVLGDPESLGCGFRLAAQGVVQYVRYKAVDVLPPGAVRFKSYYFNGNRHYRKAEKDFYITEVSFHPVWGDEAFLKSAFDVHVKARRRGVMLDPLGNRLKLEDLPKALQLSLPWYEHHARVTGQPTLLRDLDTARIAFINQLAANRIRGDIARWETLMAAFRASDGKTYSVSELETLSVSLGGSYDREYRALLAEKRPSPAMQAGGGWGGGDGGYRQVEVRSYDASGTYTGSSQTSAVWADIMKMTSSPPR